MKVFHTFCISFIFSEGITFLYLCNFYLLSLIVIHQKCFLGLAAGASIMFCLFFLRLLYTVYKNMKLKEIALPAMQESRRIFYKVCGYSVLWLSGWGGGGGGGGVVQSYSDFFDILYTLLIC